MSTAFALPQLFAPEALSERALEIVRHSIIATCAIALIAAGQVMPAQPSTSCANTSFTQIF